MSMFGLGARKPTRRSMSRSPSARRRNYIREAADRAESNSENKSNDSESHLQRDQSCFSTRTTNLDSSETLTSNKNAALSSSTNSGNGNPSLPNNTSPAPSTTLSSTSNTRPPSLHHRSPHLQQRYHQPLIQSNSTAESTR